MSITIARTLFLTALLAFLAGPAARADDGAAAMLGSAGLLQFGNLPPCLAEDYATGYERCLPPRPAADAPAEARTKSALERAAILIYLRRSDEARQELDADIAANANSVEALHLAARLAISKYRERYQPAWMEAAQSYSAAAVALAPRNADVRTTEAYIIWVKGRTEDAIAGYSAAIALQPDHSIALGQRAFLHAAHGRHVLAIKDYDTAIASAPNDRTLRYGRAKVLIDLKRPRDALADLDVIIEHAPQALAAYELRAGVHQSLGNSEAALEDLTTILHGPKGGSPSIVGGDQFISVLMRRALVLSDLNRPDEAADDMVRAVKLGGKQHILRLQIYLRRNGYIALPVDGVVSEALSTAIQNCFRQANCRSSLPQRT
jgi:tetratricopeptide (TPR) repeat protein